MVVNRSGTIGASFSARAARAVVIGALDVYRALVSPLLVAMFGRACRFEPSCSCYAREAVREHGVARGAYLAVRRLLRCHPLGGYGYDPVPARAAFFGEGQDR